MEEKRLSYYETPIAGFFMDESMVHIGTSRLMSGFFIPRDDHELLKKTEIVLWALSVRGRMAYFGCDAITGRVESVTIPPDSSPDPRPEPPFPAFDTFPRQKIQLKALEPKKRDFLITTTAGDTFTVPIFTEYMVRLVQPLIATWANGTEATVFYNAETREIVGVE